jgi:hypothetical protein
MVAMSLEQTLREMWAADPTLPGLLPVDRVFTGCPPPQAAAPLVVLERRAGRIVRNTSHGRVEQIELIWKIHTATYDEAAALAQALADCFDRQSFACAEGNVALLRQRDESRTLPRPDRPQFDMTYEATLIQTNDQ